MSDKKKIVIYCICTVIRTPMVLTSPECLNQPVWLLESNFHANCLLACTSFPLCTFIRGYKCCLFQIKQQLLRRKLKTSWRKWRLQFHPCLSSKCDWSISFHRIVNLLMTLLHNFLFIQIYSFLAETLYRNNQIVCVCVFQLHILLNVGTGLLDGFYWSFFHLFCVEC